MNSNDYTAVANASELKLNQALQVFYKQKPVVVIRTKKGLSAFEDYCPHRGLALSKGYIQNDEIHCAYHGWSFDCLAGKNKNVPVKNEALPCSLKAFYIQEKYGLLWVSSEEDAFIPQLDENIEVIALQGKIKAGLLNTLENFLEGSHTHYVHDGLIRSKKKARHPIQAKIIQNTNGFKVYYESEPPKGIVTQLLPKKLRQLYSVSTYIHPNVAVLEFFNQKDQIVSRFEAILNEEEGHTAYYARIFIHLGILNPLVKPFASRMFQKIIEQDKLILEAQQQNLIHFPEHKFYSDETDLVGTHLFAWQNQKQNQLEAVSNFCVYW
jgi:phenylpropionate dioxygenase-like ring-hydroxylating dioxygenase large terminal subunit